MTEDELEYVGFWYRVGGLLIDLLLQAAITAPLTYAVYGRYASPEADLMGTADYLINILFPAIAVICLWYRWGATPGKMAICAKVVDADTGASLSLGRATLRYMAYLVSLLPLGIGFLWVAFDRRKQGWHDKIANTVVIRPKRTQKI